MLLIYGNHAAWDRMTEADWAENEAVHGRLIAELKSTGELLEVNELLPEHSRIVRTTKGVPNVTEGAYNESVEFVSGYYLLNCAGINRASEIAGKLAEAEFSLIEVRGTAPEPS